MSCVEQIFSVNDLDLHTLRWHPQQANPKSQRILCLHGWLDNAGSFELVAEALSEQGHELLAFDMAGCGRSSHRSLHGGYNLWDDVLDAEALLDQLGWDDYILLGHSRGAMVASLFAATMPKGLAGLALIDGILPPTMETDPLVAQLKEFMSMRKDLINKNARVDVIGKSAETSGTKALSIEEAWQQRKKNCLLTFDEMLPILNRSLKPVGSGYLWSHDQRVKGRSVYRLSEVDQKHLLASLTLPGILLVAKESRLYKPEYLDIFQKSLPSFTVQVLDGKHHLHMQHEHYKNVVDSLSGFLAVFN